jgi:hypothetical protein
MGFEVSALDKWVKSICIVNVTILVLELSFHKFYIARGINLDQRIKMPEARRFASYAGYFAFSTIFIVLMFTAVFPEI